MRLREIALPVTLTIFAVIAFVCLCLLVWSMGLVVRDVVREVKVNAHTAEWWVIPAVGAGLWFLFTLSDISSELRAIRRAIERRDS